MCFFYQNLHTVTTKYLFSEMYLSWVLNNYTQPFVQAFYLFICFLGGCRLFQRKTDDGEVLTIGEEEVIISREKCPAVLLSANKNLSDILLVQKCTQVLLMLPLVFFYDTFFLSNFMLSNSVLITVEFQLTH